jgi:ATP-dependent DNA helicase PIF1
LSEYDRSRRLLSLAFPTLFPTGAADFVVPRGREVSYSDYIDHLMRYRDGRFARHERFRYVVFNTNMRRQVAGQSTFLLNRHKEQGEVTVEDIEQALAADARDFKARSILDNVVRSAGQIRGTRPYWNGRRRNLEAYVHALGRPDLFVTCSAADLQ